MHVPYPQLLNHERVKLQMGLHRFQKDYDPIVFEKLTLDVTSSIPTEKAMTNLCMAMAPKLIQTPEVSFSRPSVNPAITLWNDNEATTKAVRNKDFVLSAFFSSCRNDLFSSLSKKQKIYQSFCIYVSIYRLTYISLSASCNQYESQISRNLFANNYQLKKEANFLFV